MKTIRKVRTLTILVLLGFAFTMVFYGESQAKTQLQMPLGGVRGSYYMIGAPTAKYVNEHSDKIMVTPNTSGGGVENIRRVSQGIAHLGMATAMEMHKAWNGMAPFKKPMKKWMTIGVSTKVLLNHCATLAKYKIRNVEDTKGRIFAIGAPGSAAGAMMLEFLEFTGLAKDITMRKLPHKDYPTMLMDGKIEVFNRLGAVPSGSVEQIATQTKLALIEFDGLLKKTNFIEKHPYYQKITVPGGTYKGEARDTTFFGAAGYFIVRADLPDDIVYEFTRLAYSEASIKSVTMAFKGNGLTRATPLKGNIGPVHPGAAKFWKEIGLTIPESGLK